MDGLRGKGKKNRLALRGTNNSRYQDKDTWKCKFGPTYIIGWRKQLDRALVHVLNDTWWYAFDILNS